LLDVIGQNQRVMKQYFSLTTNQYQHQLKMQSTEQSRNHVP
jgi:hypothetical protein